MSRFRAAGPALLLAAACHSDPAPSDGDGTGSSSSVQEPDRGTTDEGGSTSLGASTSSSASTAVETSGECGFLDCEPPGPFECSTIEDTCPQGEKCNYYADDGGSSLNATSCFPVVARPDAVDDACTVEGSPVSGLDSCERGSICTWLDAETGLGTCVPFCSGSDDAPGCEDPQRVCTGGSTVVLCLQTCDPLQPGACGKDEGCYPGGRNFLCAPDTSGRGGTPLAPCLFANACQAGALCVGSDWVGACPPDTNMCCSPYCDLSDPTCPEGTACFSFYQEGDAPPEHTNLGLCGSGPV